MAYSSVIKRNMFVILPLFIILLITPLSSSLSPTDKVTKQLLSQLCAKTYSHFCLEFLSSDPGTFKLDVHGLINFVYQKSILWALHNLNSMKDLASATKDPELSLAYHYCVTDYDIAWSVILKASKLVDAKDYESASLVTQNAFNTISSCDSQLEVEKGVPASASQDNQTFLKFCNIASTFAHALKHSFSNISPA